MLFRKMIRELKKNKVQFISIFIISFLGIFIYAGIRSISLGMEDSAERFYKETNLADSKIYGNGLTDHDAAELMKSDKIKEVTKKLTIDTSYEKENDVTLQINYIDNDLVSGFHIIKGENFDQESDGIYLDSQFASEHKIKIGDEINYSFGNVKMKSKVVALIMQPDYLYAIQNENQILPNHSKYGYGYLSTKAFAMGDISYSEFLLDTNTNSKTVLDKEIKDVLENQNIIVVMKKDFASYSMFKNEILQMSSVGAIFPLVFLVIAALTTLTTMTRITTNQRLQIGTLKALGFSNGKIIRHYISYGTFIGIVSALLGLILGPILLPQVAFDFQKTFYSMPYWEGKLDYTIFLVVAVTVLLNILNGYWACKTQMDIIVARILRPKEIKSGKHSLIEKTWIWKKVGFAIQWNVRDVNRNKIRSFITVLGIVGCMMLILCAIGMQNTTSKLTTVMYGELHQYNTKVVLSDNDRVDFSKNKDYQYIYEGAMEYKDGDTIEVISETVVGEGSYLLIQNEDEEIVDYPTSGVAISRKIAKEYHIKKGDKIEVRQYGTQDWKTCTVNLILNVPMGQGIYMSQKAYEKMEYEFLPTSFLTMKPATDFDVKEYASIQTKSNLIDSIDSMMEMLNGITGIMITAAIVLGVVVLYNLGAMSFYEKTREMATLKVLGFQYLKLSTLLRQQNTWLTIIGILIGMPCGYLLLANMMKYMGDSMDMRASINLITYIGSAVGIFVLSTGINIILNKKLKKIDMVSALKSVE